MQGCKLQEETGDMKVSNILQAKGADVHDVRPDETVAKAAQVLAAHNIGAVLARHPDGSLAGIISERDIVRRIAKDGAAVLDRPASEIMTRNLHTCKAEDTVDRLMEIMTAQRIRHVPVVDEDGKVLGMISIGDVVKRKIEESAREAEVLKEYIATG